MQKNKTINRWFWKWHVISGLISLPFMLLLCVTGILYLFKEYYNDFVYDEQRFVSVPVSSSTFEKNITSYDEQLTSVRGFTDGHVVQVVLPLEDHEATAFRLHGKKGDHTRNFVYVDPYTAKVTGQVDQRDTLMYKIRKLHGELLLDKPGSYAIEIAASWFLVLILTGIYVWWPGKRFKQAGLAGFFTIRTKKGRRIFYRDLHAVGGFWLSVFMLIILAGGMPWTEVFGSQLKWVQKQTNTGYPENWNNSRGLSSDQSLNNTGQIVSLDRMVSIAQSQNLEGQLTIKLPMNDEQVFSVMNRSFWLRDQRSLHFDQYSGDLIQSYEWSDVGILMEMRQVAMRLHQGEYGLVNWIILLAIVFVFTLATASGLVSYILRKPKGRWGIPSVPESFRVDYGLGVLVVFLGIVFPMFGGSVVFILVLERVLRLFAKDNLIQKTT